jgi:type VI secretion system protein ImpB
MSESIQHKLDRVRPPRVQITYDVETLGAIQMKELPFVMGIMADLAGEEKDLDELKARDESLPKKERLAQGYIPLPKLADRKFVEIDRDNFNDVLRSLLPHLKLTGIPNKLAAKEGEEKKDLVADLYFKHMDDFEPVNIIKQVPELNKLYMARQYLSDLGVKLEGNDKLGELLKDVVENTEGLTELKAAKPESKTESDDE